MRCQHLALSLAIVLGTTITSWGAEPEVPCADCQQTPTVEKKPNVVRRIWLGICRDFKRNNSWPDPFVTLDRASVRVPFDTMVANGWRIQNTLSEYHFVPETGKLTEAGRLKIAAIINDTPCEYRAIFVFRTEDQAIAAERIASVQEVAAVMLADREPVPIFETFEKPRNTASSYVEAVKERYDATIPDPRLPANSDANADAGNLPN